MAKQLRVFIEFKAGGIGQVKGEVGALKTAVEGAGGTFRVAGAQTERWNAQLGKTREALGQINQSLGMLRNLAGAGLGAVLAGGALLIKQGLGISATFEANHLALETLLKSKAKADRLMADVVKFTATTPFELKEVTDATQQVLAFGGSLEQVPRLLKTIGEAAATMKVPLEQAFRAYFGLRQGLVDRVQLGAVGVSTEHLEAAGIKFNSQGGMESSGAAAAEAFLKVLEGRFGGMFARVNQTLGGILSNLKDTITLGLKEIGDAVAPQVKAFAQGIIERITAFLGDENAKGRLRAAFASIGAAFQPLSEHINNLLDMLAQNPQALVEGLARAIGVVRDLTAAFIALAAAQAVVGLLQGILAIIAGGPGAWIAGGILGGGLIAAFFGLREKIGELLPTMNDLNTGLSDTAPLMSEAGSRAGQLAKDLEPLRNAARDTKDEINNINTELKRLRDQTPEGIADTEAARQEALKARNEELFRKNKLKTDELGKQLADYGRTDFTGSPGTYEQWNRGVRAGTVRGSGLLGDYYWALGQAYLNSPEYNQGFDKAAENDMTAAMKNRRFAQNSQAGFIPDNADGTEPAITDYISAQARAFITKHEGKRTKVYRDPVGYPTVGIGHLMSDKENARWPVGTTLSDKEVEELFQQDYDEARDAVLNAVKVPLNQNQFDALVSLAFNIGGGGLAKSSVVKKLNNGDFAGAADAFLSWNKAKGKVLPGLTSRRKAERELFLSTSDSLVFNPGGEAVFAEDDPAAGARRSRAGLGVRISAALQDTQQKIDRATEAREREIEAAQKQVSLFEKVKEGIEKFVDAAKEQIEKLNQLRTTLIDQRDNLTVAIQLALGNDRGADVARGEILLRRAREATENESKLRAQGSDEAKLAEALSARAEAVTAVLNMVAGLQGNENAGDIRAWLMDHLGPLMEGLPEDLDSAIRTLDERLGDASTELATAGSALQRAADALMSAAGALASAQGNGELAGQIADETFRMYGGNPEAGSFSQARGEGGTSTGWETASPGGMDWSFSQAASGGAVNEPIIGEMSLGEAQAGFPAPVATGNLPTPIRGKYPVKDNSAEEAARAARQRAIAGGQMIGDALHLIANVIRNKGEGLLQALGGFIAKLAGPQFGPIVSGIVDIIGAFTGKKKAKLQAEITNQSLPVHFAQSTGWGFASNISSAAYGGRPRSSGTAPQVVVQTVVKYASGGLERMVEAVSEVQANNSMRDLSYGRPR